MKNKTSFRINFDNEDVEFMNLYKEEFGSTIQWFVESAVRTKIDQFKLDMEIREFGKVQNVDLKQD